MVVACAVLCNDVPIMLQHVQLIAVDDTQDFPLGIVVNRGRANVDRSSDKLLWLPSRGNVSYQPVLSPGIVHIDCSGFGADAGFRPVHPNSKLQSIPMSLVRNRCESVW